MKTFLFGCLLFVISPLPAQVFEWAGGPSLIQWRSKDVRGRRFLDETLYPNVSTHIGVRTHVSSWLFMRATIGYEAYGGEFRAVRSDRTFDVVSEIDVRKSGLLLGLFPLGITLWKRLDIDLGVQISWLIKERFFGTFSKQGGFEPTVFYRLEDQYEAFNTSVTFGITGRVGYKIPLGTSFFLMPMYSFYQGLSDEFQFFPRETTITRHFLGIGIVFEPGKGQ